MENKEEINDGFSKMNDMIDTLGIKVGDSVNMHRKDFFDRFRGEMYNIHSNYKEL